MLFTGPVAGPTLADLIDAEPGRTRELLALVLADVAAGLARDGVGEVVERTAIRERGIAGTFHRKFNGLSATAYLRRTGHGETLAVAADRLRRARPLPPSRAGDLRHLRRPQARARRLLRPRPAGLPRLRADARSPGRGHRETPFPPTARADRPPPAARRPAAASLVLGGADSFVRARLHRLPAETRSRWLRELVVLALMDTLNILSTYLTCLPDLPLSAHAAAVRDRARTLADLLDHATAPLASGDDGATWWRLYLTRVREAVSACESD
ncbi:hypothetical protein ABT117_16765 [Streptomyces sp. NPDC002262]|uniref:hypothetical protein n=1 Tax=Streptomyces sp. NPDC002262 TaxID=3154414 RepID=UPI00332153F0